MDWLKYNGDGSAALFMAGDPAELLGKNPMLVRRSIARLEGQPSRLKVKEMILWELEQLGLEHLHQWAFKSPTEFYKIVSSNADGEVVEEGKRGWKLVAPLALVMSAIGTPICLVIILKSLDDPAALGPRLAIGYLTMV